MERPSAFEYVEDKNQISLDKMKPIGYYELETDLKGEIVDDWFVLEKEKYFKNIEQYLPWILKGKYIIKTESV